MHETELERKYFVWNRNVKLLTKDALGVAELLTLFEYPDAISEIPFRPEGGEMFVFKSASGKKDEWKADGFFAQSLQF